MKLAQIISWLQCHKDDGTWRRIAGASQVHYDTLARIARGAMKTPGVLVCERMADAILAEDPRASATPAEQPQAARA